MIMTTSWLFRGIGLSLLAGVLAGAGCAKPAAPPAPPPPAVTVVPVTERDVIEWDEYTGRLDAVELVEVRARVSGYLDKIHFKEGREVKKGDPLFTIDPRPYQAEYDHDDAEYQQSQSRAELARNDFERAKRLVATKAISEEDYDTKSKAFTEAQAAVLSAKAARELAKLNLEFTEIRTPIAGRTSRALITEGNLVSGGVSGAGATLLTTIVSVDPVYCYVDVDERSVLKYIQLRREGKRVSARDQEIPAEMALANEEGYPHKGYIDFVENRVDSATGTIRARGVFPNPDRTFSPGFFARLRVPGSAKYPALLVPERALNSDQAQKFVYVVGADQNVQFRPVVLGALIDGERVVASGLKPGESVITEGLLRVRPGLRVNPQPPTLPVAAAK